MAQVQANLTFTGLMKWAVPQFLGFPPLLKWKLFSRVPLPQPTSSQFIASSHHLQAKVFARALRAWEPPPSFAFSPRDGKLCCTQHTRGEGHYKRCGNATMTPCRCFQWCGTAGWTTAGALALERSDVVLPRCISNTSSISIAATVQYSERKAEVKHNDCSYLSW